MSKRFSLLCAFVITIVVFVTFQPGFRIGFLDGWWYLQWVGTMDLPRYLIQFLDPRNVTQGYRPVQGLYVLVQYLLFGFNPDGYHFAQTLLHAANSALFFLVVSRLSRRSRIALVAALVYAVSPVFNLAVFWNAVVDPLSAFFYLLTILLWIHYQEKLTRTAWTFSFAAFIFALFSKEVAAFLPLFLMLIERWFFHRKPAWRTLFWEYVSFFVLLVPFALLEMNVQSHGEFVGQFKYSIGPHMLGNLIPYMAVLAFPWVYDLPRANAYYVWLTVAALLYLGIVIYRKSLPLLFLGLFAVLNIVPLLGFPLDYFNTRYLYISTMASAVLIALIVEYGGQRLGRNRFYQIGASVALVLVVLGSSVQVSEAANGLAEFTRQVRVPFRDISRQHPNFPEDTYLYFLHSPTTPLVDFQGLFFVRYGTGIKVQGTDDGSRAELFEHNAAFVYYFDDTGKPVELPVDKNSTTNAAPALPANLGGSLVVDRVQVPSTSIQQGKALVAILEWSVERPVNVNYTAFAHLLNAKGEIVAGYDSPPRRGEIPTSTWTRGQIYVDALVVPVNSDVPLGDNYKLELGMYDPETMERLPVVDANGTPVKDAVVVEPFRVVAADTQSP